MLFASSFAGAQSFDSEIGEAIEDIYSGDRYQSEPPFDVKTEKVEKKVPEKKKEEREPYDFSALEFLGKIIFFGFLVVVVLLLAKAAYSYFSDLKRRPQNKTTVEDEASSYARVTSISEELSRETLEHADQLANQGQFEAAIRVILMCCLKHVRESYYATLPDALTNREILQADWLPTDISSKMAIIVNAEELTEFGGRPAGQDEFTSCRNAFQVFLAPNLSTRSALRPNKDEKNTDTDKRQGETK
ncbi:hypothetical protein [Kiloniella litopenaei]|uniref:hypothetical protein n=1 Tax=Kiloniella litopenaei TaxID=1549748 RepID=UPI003BAD4CF0